MAALSCATSVAFVLSWLCVGAAAFGTRQVRATYLGCFMDHVNSTRAMPGMKYYGITRIGSVTIVNNLDSVTSPQMTQEICAGVCAMSDFRYFGVQATDWCFCDNAYGWQGSAPESDCNQNCAGNSSQKCGGAFRNSVYQLSYLNPNMFSIGNRTLVALAASSPAIIASITCRLVQCLYTCDQSSDCRAAVFSQQLGLCRLLQFPAFPASLVNDSISEFFVRR